MSFEDIKLAVANLQDPTKAEIRVRTNPYMQKLLYDLIVTNCFQHVLEIGTYKGYTTAYLAAACQETGGHVTTINIDGGELEVARRALKALDLEATCLQGDSVDVLKTLVLSKRYDFVLIDGLHRYTQVIQEHNLLEPVMIQPGIMIFDDCGDDAGDVASVEGADGGVIKAAREANAILCCPMAYKIYGDPIMPPSDAWPDQHETEEP